MKPHYSMLQNILRFGTSHEVWKLVFGVPNAKNLAFDTPDTVALNRYVIIIIIIIIIINFNSYFLKSANS